MHATDGNGSRQELKLGFRTLVAVVGLFVVGWGAAIGVLTLMFYPRSDGEALRSDVNHHVEDSAKTIKKLEKKDEKVSEALRRIELRQVEAAPRRVRERLEVIAPLPRDLPPGTFDP